MTAKWKLEYYSSPNWVEMIGKFTQTIEELNGHEEGDIILPNTLAYRALIASNQTVRISFDTHVLYTGQLSAVTYTATQLKCTLYNAVYEAMKAKTITADYSAGAVANVVFAAVCSAAGVTAGSCPSTIIAVKFVEADCYNSAIFIASILGLDYSASGGTFNIGTFGSLKTAVHYKIESRSIDRAKKRDKVKVRGVSAAGLSITGEAGTGTNVKVYIENAVSDQASLDSLAAKYLAELNTDSQGAPVTFPIDEAYHFHAGDTFATSNPVYNLDGVYRMEKVTKTPTKATVELDKAQDTLDKVIVDLQQYNDLGIYGVSVQSILIEYSVDGAGGWHSTMTEYDLFMHISVDGGVTYGLAVRIAGTEGSHIEQRFTRSAEQPDLPN
jgi:hypothetical protein